MWRVLWCVWWFGGCVVELRVCLPDDDDHGNEETEKTGRAARARKGVAQAELARPPLFFSKVGQVLLCVVVEGRRALQVQSAWGH